MSDLPTLDGPSLSPEDGPPEQLVILLHGVGADGHDLFGLVPHFRTILPRARFVAPHAPFPFDMMPMGRQWFGIQDFSPEARLAGVRAAAPILDAFIDAQLRDAGLTEARTALIGFSQGTMMALHVGLRRHHRLAAILGYSGMLVGARRLSSEIFSYPPIMLAHGTDDDVLAFSNMRETMVALMDAGLEVEAHARPGLGHGIDDVGIALGQTFLAGAFAGT